MSQQTAPHRLPMSVVLAEFERDGHRPLVGDEADKLRYMEPVTVLDTATGELSTGKVIAGRDDVIKVLFRSGCIMAFDVDNPAFWPDAEQRDRKPPTAHEDGRDFVIVTKAPYPQVVTREPLFNALKASKEIGDLRAQVKRQADAIQGLPTRDEYDALHADVLRLTSELNAMRALLTPRFVA